MSHSHTFLLETAQVATQLDANEVENLACALSSLRKRAGRLFFLGVGGSAANAAHAVNDFRKLCGIEAYAPTDNVAELTARTNDEGWNTVFSEWLKISQLSSNDAIFILSVGGGNVEKNVSANLANAVAEAKQRGATIFGIVGRDGGFTKQVGDHVIVIPTVHAERVTPHAESFQAVIWHCLVSHPTLQMFSTKW